mgnify:CR=1 FL=1
MTKWGKRKDGQAYPKDKSGVSMNQRHGSTKATGSKMLGVDVSKSKPCIIRGCPHLAFGNFDRCFIHLAKIQEQIEREDQNKPYEAPTCRKCFHENPDYKIVSNKGGVIKLRCVHCGAISTKD